MAHHAHYDTAITYLKAEFRGRAYESLLKALTDFSAEDIAQQHPVYLHTLSLLGQMALQDGDRVKALPYIIQGLRTNEDNVDFQFMKALCCWDEGRYDEMLEAIIRYLMVLTQLAHNTHYYNFVGPKVLQEIYATLLPEAYKKAASASQIKHIIKKLADKTGNPYIKTAYNTIVEVESQSQSQVNE